MNKKIGSINDLIFDLFLLFVGIMCFNKQFLIWNFVWIILCIGTLFLCLNQIFLLFIKRKIGFSFTNIAKLIAGFIFLFYLAYKTEEIAIFIPYVVGWWALLISTIQFVNYYVYRKDGLKGVGYRLFMAIVSLIIGLYLIINPIGMLFVLTNISGLYLVFSSFISIIEGFKEILSEAFKQKITKHLNISLPIFFATILPIKVFMSISNLKKQKQINSDDFDIEVFIYLKKQGPESLGHVDIAYKDLVYSYGLHDPEKRHLFGTLGDGVLIISQKDSFIKQHIETEKKLIISYGIKLSENQIEIVQTRIKELMSRTIAWKCALANGDKQALDYASRVFKETNAKMYKFTTGKFRTYFVFSTNCVLLSDHIIRSKQLDLLNLNGMVSPGSYISFLNNEYMRGSSNVVSRIIRGDQNV